MSVKSIDLSRSLRLTLNLKQSYLLLLSFYRGEPQRDVGTISTPDVLSDATFPFIKTGIITEACSRI